MGLLDRPPQSQRYGLLSPDVMSLIQSGGPRVAPAAPAAPRRERVSGWRVLDRVLGGETVSAGLDAERARLQAEADAPRLQAIAAENEGIARSLGPQALLALRLNGEKLGGELSEGFGTDVVAAGSGLFQGGRRVGEQATYDTSGDQTLRRDSSGVAPVYTRTEPSIAERTAMSVAETGRINATNPMNVAPGGQLRDPRTGALIAEGANRIFSAADATDLVDETGNPIYRNERDAPPVDPNAANSADSRTQSALNAITNTRGAIQRARGQAGFWTTGPLSALPLNTPARDLNASLDTIKANLSFNELARMRSESPTGGALGSIAVRELDLLGSTVASLDQAQSQQELLRSMDVIDASLARWEAAVRQSASQPAPSAGRRLSPQEAAALPSGTRFIGTDGIERVRQ